MKQPAVPSQNFWTFGISVKIIAFLVLLSGFKPEWISHSPWIFMQAYLWAGLIVEFIWLYIAYRFFRYKEALFVFVFHLLILFCETARTLWKYIFERSEEDIYFLEVCGWIFSACFCISILASHLRRTVQLVVIAMISLVFLVLKIAGIYVITEVLFASFCINALLWILVFYNEMKSKEREDVLDSIS